MGKVIRRQCVKCPAMPGPVGNRKDDGKLQLRTKETDFFLSSFPQKKRYSTSPYCTSLCVRVSEEALKGTLIKYLGSICICISI